MPIQNIVKAYGLHWKPEWIYKAIKRKPSRNRFVGNVKRKTDKKYYKIDFWKTRGIYALFKNFEIVYVGQVTNLNLGERIRTHFNDRGEHWDTFSFFCFSDINFEKSEKTGDVSFNYKKLNSWKVNIIQTFEAIIINTAEPFLNKQETKFPGAFKATQVKFTDDKSLEMLYQKIESLEKNLNKIAKK